MMKSLLAAAFLAASLSPALAGPEHLTIIGQQCASQLKLSAAVCNCMVQKAGAELNNSQQAFMAAQVTGNTAEVARVQGMMTAQEAVATGQFMTSVVGQCGG